MSRVQGGCRGEQAATTQYYSSCDCARRATTMDLQYLAVGPSPVLEKPTTTATISSEGRVQPHLQSKKKIGLAGEGCYQVHYPPRVGYILYNLISVAVTASPCPETALSLQVQQYTPHSPSNPPRCIGSPRDRWGEKKQEEEGNNMNHGCSTV